MQHHETPQAVAHEMHHVGLQAQHLGAQALCVLGRRGTQAGVGQDARVVASAPEPTLQRHHRQAQHPDAVHQDDGLAPRGGHDPLVAPRAQRASSTPSRARSFCLMSKPPV